MYAFDLGQIGPTHEIAEQNLLNIIKETLKKLKPDDLKQKYNDLISSYSKKPRGIDLKQAHENKLIKLDMRVKLDKDIQTADGNVLYHKGTVIDPLLVTSLKKPFCFIDTRSTNQIAWAKSVCKDSKIVLVNGELSAISGDFKVFFDQDAKLSKRFNITELPAKLYQKENSLYVEIFAI